MMSRCMVCLLLILHASPLLTAAQNLTLNLIAELPTPEPESSSLVLDGTNQTATGSRGGGNTANVGQLVANAINNATGTAADVTSAAVGGAANVVGAVVGGVANLTQLASEVTSIVQVAASQAGGKLLKNVHFVGK